MPQQYISQPAIAIPCRLFNLYPLDDNSSSTYKWISEIHSLFVQFVMRNVDCQACDVLENGCYDIKIDIPRE
jgi:hypothetical protein